MPFTFEIRPLNIETGYSLSCTGVIVENVHRRKLISAVAEAVALGRGLTGEIRIYDCDGLPVEIVPLPAIPGTIATPSL